MKRYFLLFLFLILCKGPDKPVILPTIQEAPLKTREEIQKDLKSSEWHERSQAVIEVSKQNLREFIPVLRELLQKDTNAAVRGTAALSLADLEDKSSSKLIQNLFLDKEISTDIVLDALGRLKDPSSSNSILPVLESSNDVYRLQAVEALVNIGNSSIGGEILKQATKSKDMEKAKTYAMVFGKLKIKLAESYLINLVEKSEASPTLAASILALGRIQSKKAVPLLVRMIERDFDKGRENAVESLKLIQDTSGNQFLVKLIQNEKREIQSAASDALSSLYDMDTAKQVHELLKSKKKNLFAPCTYILGRYKYEESRKDIEDILVDESNPDREVIGQSLGWIQNKESISVLVKVLNEKKGEGRYGAAWSLGMLKAVEAIEDLKKASTSSDIKLSRIAIESIGLIGSEESLEFLDKLVIEKKDFAPTLLTSIASIQSPKSIAIIEKYLFSKDSIVQQSALQASLQKKDKELISPLLKLLEETNSSEISNSVQLCLKNITGEKFRTKNEWLNWARKSTK
jgi:HEAT repeat protein